MKKITAGLEHVKTNWRGTARVPRGLKSVVLITTLNVNVCMYSLFSLFGVRLSRVNNLRNSMDVAKTWIAATFEYRSI